LEAGRRKSEGMSDRESEAPGKIESSSSLGSQLELSPFVKALLPYVIKKGKKDVRFYSGSDRSLYPRSDQAD
jgi:hypothetical protein